MFSFPESYLLLFNPWGDWPFVSTWPRTPFTSTITVEAFLGEQECVGQEKIIELVHDRLRSRKRLCFSAVQDQREDQPAVSLQVGTSRSRTVCRIARYFPRKDFHVFIELFQKKLDEKPKIAENFDSREKLKEIFLIPDEIAAKVFQDVQSGKELSPLKRSKAFLERLRTITESQLAQLNPIPVGTGFLVGANHLLTNCHVLFDEEVARQCVAQFNCEESLDGLEKTVAYELDPDALFIQEPSLDYALVQLKFNQLTRQAGHNFGWLHLVEDDSNIIPGISEEILQQLKQLDEHCQLLSEEQKVSEEQKGDNVILIHHPKGGQKKADLTNNRVVVGGLYEDFLRYQGGSDYGSSGCPIFDIKWDLIALNHAAIPDGNTFVKQGVRICSIVADLKKKSFSSLRLKSFIDDFVTTAEQLNHPPLPTALEFSDGTYVDCGCGNRLNNEGAITVNKGAITVEAWVRNSDPDSDGVIFHRGGSFEEPGYCVWRCNGRIRVELQKHHDNPKTMRNKSVAIITPEPTKEKIITDTDGRFLMDQEWHHIAFTWNGKRIKPINDAQISENIKIYVDGKEEPLHLVPESLESTVFSEGFRGIDDSEVRLNIGRAEIIDKLIEGLKFNQQNASSYPSPIIAAYCTQSSAYLRLDIARKCYFKGAITEVRLWKKARSLPEIQETMFQRLNIENGLTDENLVAYWKLEESIGNRVFNIVCKELLNCKKSLAGKTLEEYQNLGLNNSENLFNTLFNPTASFGQTNNSPNFGIRLNGISDYVDCGQLNILQEDCQGFNAITVEAWVKNLGKMSDGMIVYQGGGWNEDGFSIWKRNQKLRVELQASDEDKKKKLIFDTEDDVFSGNNPKKDDPGEDDSDANENELDSERWYHVSFTWSVGQEIKIYVNGNFKHSNPVNQYEKTCVKSKEEFSKTIIPKVKLNIGRSENYGRYFYGSIAEVRIWDLIRDKNEINKNMNNRLSENTSGLVGYWRLDESDGDRAANSSQPGGNTKPSYDDYGLVHGGVWEKLYSALDLEISQGAYGVISSQARIVRASQYPALDLPCGLRFKEEGSSVEVKDLSIGQDGTQLKGLTVEAWIKHEYGNCFIVKHTDEQGKNCYSLSWYEGKIRVELQSKEEPKTEELVVYTEDDFPDDHLWHHLAFSLGGYSSKDSSDGEVSIYIDGRLQRCVVNGRCSTILAAMQAKTIGLFKGFPTGFQGNLEIGSKEEGTDYYSIAICDIRLWKVARSPDQIQKYMTCRLSAQDAARELFVEYQHKAREAERDVLEDQPNDDVVNPPARAPEPNPDDSVLGYWKNLVGYWRLDDCSGEEAFNQKGKKHGVISNALRFPELKPEHKELVL